MFKTFDFKCNTCDRVFEEMVEGDRVTVKCPSRSCGGWGQRQLGGRPLRVSGSTDVVTMSDPGGHRHEHLVVTELGSVPLSRGTLRFGIVDRVPAPEGDA